jgi:hypothetical protein
VGLAGCQRAREGIEFGDCQGLSPPGAVDADAGQQSFAAD